MRVYTKEQAITVAEKMNTLAREKVFKEKISLQKKGIGYTALMMSFGCHMLVSVETLLCLKKHFSEFFPTTVAYTVLRTMFETLIEAHYISKNPEERVNAYIDYGAVLDYQRYKRLKEYKCSEDDFLKFWIDEQIKVMKKAEESFEKIKKKYEHKNKYGKVKIFRNWANKSLEEKAKEVNHGLEYTHYYANFSNFTHANIKLTQRFMKFDKMGTYWSTKADDIDVGFIFLYASELFACFLTLFSKQFNLKIENEINNCLYAYGKLNSINEFNNKVDSLLHEH